MYRNEKKIEMGNILDFLERTEERFGYKTAVEDEKLILTYHELVVMAKRIGSAVSRRVEPGRPVPVRMEKSPLTLAVMFGIIYAGCFYVPVNPENPPERQKKIFKVLDARLIITDQDMTLTDGHSDMPGGWSTEENVEVLTGE